MPESFNIRRCFVASRDFWQRSVFFWRGNLISRFSRGDRVRSLFSFGVTLSPAIHTKMCFLCTAVAVKNRYEENSNIWRRRFIYTNAVCLYNEQEPPWQAVLFWQTDVCFYDRSGGLSGGSFLEVGKAQPVVAFILTRLRWN